MSHRDLGGCVLRNRQAGSRGALLAPFQACHIAQTTKGTLCKRMRNDRGQRKRLEEREEDLDEVLRDREYSVGSLEGRLVEIARHELLLSALDERHGVETDVEQRLHQIDETHAMEGQGEGSTSASG